MRLPPALRGKVLLAGALVAVQSYCLYSAVSLIPAGLALLVFQTCPMLYVLLSGRWARKCRGRRRSPPMVHRARGLALSAQHHADKFSAQWDILGSGVMWGLRRRVQLRLRLLHDTRLRSRAWTGGCAPS
jgi:hypothetical protein